MCERRQRSCGEATGHDPSNVEVLRSDCDARHQKCDPERHTPPADLCRFQGAEEGVSGVRSFYSVSLDTPVSAVQNVCSRQYL